MNGKKKIAVVLLILGLGVIIYWAAVSRSLWTMTKVPVEKTVKDEIFGTTSTTTEWKDEFRLGLEYAGPIAGVLLLGSGAMFWMGRKEDRRNAGGSRT